MTRLNFGTFFICLFLAIIVYGSIESIRMVRYDLAQATQTAINTAADSLPSVESAATTSSADTSMPAPPVATQAAAVASAPVSTAGLLTYILVTDGCGPHFDGECLNVRSGPGTDYPVVRQLRNGVVLKVDGAVTEAGEQWYHIVFDEWLRYPERVAGDWYVNADYVEVVHDVGPKSISDTDYTPASTTKKIIVDRSEQMLRSYDGDELFLETTISTGLELTPTPRGEFTVFSKTPSRYMQGPLPYLVDQQVYDLPGVPWNLYFTEQGAVIHGAYWHNSFGSPYSHGCVNVAPEIARELYTWADLGTQVIVRD